MRASPLKKKKYKKQIFASEHDALYLAHCCATCNRELGFVLSNVFVFHIVFSFFWAKLQPSERKNMKKKAK